MSETAITEVASVTAQTFEHREVRVRAVEIEGQTYFEFWQPGVPSMSRYHADTYVSALERARSNVEPASP